MIATIFAKHPNISILDYGGGNGILAEKMRKAGFRRDGHL